MYGIIISLNQIIIGVVVQVVQDNIPMATDNVITKGEYFRWVFAGLCGMMSALIVLMTLIAWKVKLGER